MSLIVSKIWLWGVGPVACGWVSSNAVMWWMKPNAFGIGFNEGERSQVGDAHPALVPRIVRVFAAARRHRKLPHRSGPRRCRQNSWPVSDRRETRNRIRRCDHGSRCGCRSHAGPLYRKCSPRGCWNPTWPPRPSTLHSSTAAASLAEERRF